MNKPTNYTTMPSQFNVALHARTRTQKMQDIVEKLIVLTEIEDSIIEDEAFQEEEPQAAHDIQTIPIEGTVAVTEEVTQEDI